MSWSFDATFHKWLAVLDTLEADPGSLLEPHWQTASERYFMATQDATHVITGTLKGSGAVRVDRDGDRLVGRVAYGSEKDPAAYYAVYEFGRGGDHDALSVGWVAEGELAFIEALDDMWRSLPW